MMLCRIRRWAYPDGVVVEIPLDIPPDMRPPATLAEVPADWPRKTTAPPPDPWRR
jgi:hypothetical protein